jgi:hypothetical protein
MSDFMDSTSIVQYLVSVWVARLPSLGQYLHEQFGCPLVQPHQVKRLFIAQTADGDLAAGNIGGVYSSKWTYTEGILEQVQLDYAYREMYETDASGELYVSPSFLFFCDQGAVLLSERYGPTRKLRLRGRVISTEEPIAIEWLTLWSTGK